MAETINARDANHHFARLLREVEGGKEFVVTRGGVPVARIVAAQPPSAGRMLTPEQEAALARTLKRLKGNRWEGSLERVNRDEIYDDARGWMQPE